MPYKSQAQERYFNANRAKLEKQGVDVNEWNAASKGKQLPKRLARGGEIRPLKTETPLKAVEPESPYKVLKEEKDHFLVMHKSEPSRAFRVAKFGLGHKTIGHIRSQLMAPGVPHLEGGGDPADPSTQQQAELDRQLAARQQARADRSAADEAEGVPPNPFGQPGGPGAYAQPVPVADTLKPGYNPHQFQEAPPEPPGGPAHGADIDPNQGRQDWGDASNKGASMFDQHGAGFEDVQGGSSGPVPAAEPKKPAGPGEYNAAGDLKKAMGMENDAANAYAAAKGELGKSQAAAQQWYMDQHAAISAKIQQQRDALDKDITQTVDDIKNFKLDPNRVWGTGGTGVLHKTMAAIGMILSGAGSGLTGQPNMAMAVVNKAIDRDIDAQKTDLANKNTLLNVYFKKYGNLEQAELRAKMDLHANLQARLDMAAAKATGPLAKAEAMKAAGENLQKYSQLRDEFLTHSMQRELAKTQIASEQLRMGLTMQQQQLKQKALALAQSGQGLGASDVNLLGEDAKKWAPALNGQWYPTASPEAAKEVRDAANVYQPFIHNVDAITKSARDLSLLSANTPWSPAMGDIVARMNAATVAFPEVVGGFKRLNEREVELAKQIFTEEDMKIPMMRQRLMAKVKMMRDLAMDQYKTRVGGAFTARVPGVNTPESRADLSNAFNHAE